MIKIAWVARDGYLDLLPLVARKLEEKGLDVHSCFLCHTENEKEHLRLTYGIEDAVVLADEIHIIKQRVEFSCENLNAWAEKYNAFPLVRTLWSTMFETDLKEDEIVSQMVSHFVFWEKFLVDSDIDLLFYERPSIMSTCIAWLISEKIGIKSVDFIDTVLNTMTITDSWHGDYCNELQQKLLEQKIDKNSATYEKTIRYINKMKEKPEKTTESFLTSLATHQKGSITLKHPSSIQNSLKIIKQKGRYFIYDSLSRKFRKDIKYLFRYNVHKFYNFFENNLDSAEDKYFLFPLHMQGEWSNHIIMGLGYSHIESLIKHIAQCLPPMHKLYVKEHVSMFAEHSFKFYKELKQFRNVKLISPFEDTFQLIRNSKGICTIGSTMGFEGLLLDKPVILLGEPWYRLLSGVYKADSPEKVAELFQNADQLKVPTEQEKVAMVHALFEISFDAVRMPQPNALASENITRLAEALSQYLFRNKRGAEYDKPDMHG